MTKQQWETSLESYPEHNFLQSWAWGEFHQKLGHPVYRVISEKWMFQAVVEPAKRARYLTIPGGPLVQDWNKDTLTTVVSSMKDIAKKERCAFIRIRPQVFDTLENRLVIQKLGFRSAPMHLHAELTRVLNVTKSDEQLLSEMRKGTRYEIRKAQKMNIRVAQSADEALIDDFIRLQSETAKREQFVPFSRQFILEQFREFKKDRAVQWFYINSRAVIPGEDPESIEKNLYRSRIRSGMTNRVISIAFVIFYNSEAIYHYAASSQKAREIPAAYALQWAIIHEARRRGCTAYNLWGDVANSQLSSHRFAGPSLFKRGFGGQQIAYLHTHDLPISNRYWINWTIESIRKNLRKL